MQAASPYRNSLTERGGREPRLTTIARLAQALKMKSADLLDNVR